jgi:hypothetical protein
MLVPCVPFRERQHEHENPSGKYEEDDVLRVWNAKAHGVSIGVDHHYPNEESNANELELEGGRVAIFVADVDDAAEITTASKLAATV